MRTVRDLIAYNDLKKFVIDPGFCSLCGACEAACPVHALKVEDRTLRYIHDCSEYMDFCPICYDVCPHTEALLLETLGFITDAPKRSETLGYYRKVLLARSTDPKLRELSHGGGVVTAFLIHCIKEGFIDSAVVSRSEPKVPIKLKPLISLVPDDMLSAVDSKFSTSAVATAFGKAVYEYGKTKIAFVGTPCQVLALRKLESWEHKIMDSLKVIVGLMCLWSFSLPSLFEYFLEEYGIKAEDIMKISLNEKYIVQTIHGDITIPISEVEAHILSACRTCGDFGSELADISVGGANPLKDWSTVIIRTEIGEKLFEDAVENGTIEVRNIEEEPEVFKHLVEMMALKKRLALEEIARREKAGELLPPSTLRLTRLMPRELGFLSNITAGDVMTRRVMTVTPNTTVEELLNIMMKHHHMGYPVVNDKEELVGIVTFEDMAEIPSSQRTLTLVKDIFHKKLVTAHPDENLLSIYNKMSEHRIGRVPIVNQKNAKKIVGIVTKTDILHMLKWPMKLK